MKNTGIPTVYRGRQYRSRLEARWAAMFDLLGWPFEYEPFELAGWIPDFLIRGKGDFLVEVKPVTEFPEDVALEIARSGWEYEVLLLGCTVPARPSCSHTDHAEPIGWLFMPSSEGWYAADAFLVDSYRVDKSLTFGLCACCGPSLDRISGTPCPDDKWTWEVSHAVEFWTRAGNLTQWRGKQSVVS